MVNNKLDVLLAPVLVTCYTRFEQLKQTVESLKNCDLADQTEIYFCSDAPKFGDEEKVQKVREYLIQVSGFKKVHLIFHSENKGVGRSVIQTRAKLLDSYNKVIFTEDDNVFAPGFLRFMNDALESYKDDLRVLAISGYTPPVYFAKDTPDVIVSKRFMGWGWGGWKRTFEASPIITNERLNALYSRLNVNELHGHDRRETFRHVERKLLIALDLHICFAAIEQDKVIIQPAISLVNNIGHDGSGVHFCNVTNVYENKKLNKKVALSFDNLDFNCKEADKKLSDFFEMAHLNAEFGVLSFKRALPVNCSPIKY
ncbi:glycosyltransferase [Shewanella halifaxensis]|uniref:glycosyltransferase n=1 Tax=Shewanella halifaxensis TaxID=271098 RepID=UPI000D5A1DE6|nr:glycosyltransferase [Shewanella halifaxensis]